MSTDSMVNVGSSMTSGVTKRRALVTSHGSSRIHGDERHRNTGADAWDEPLAMTPAKSAKARSIRRGAAIVVACLIAAIMVLGFVVASLGLGNESHSGAGPDRPPPPSLLPAPAPPPDLPISP
jgi:hypothetical protein